MAAALFAGCDPPPLDSGMGGGGSSTGGGGSSTGGGTSSTGGGTSSTGGGTSSTGGGTSSAGGGTSSTGGGTSSAGGGTSSTGGGTSSAGGGSSAAGGGASPDGGLIPIFVAQGNMGRTMISCDDGHSWVGNRSWDLEGDWLVCGTTTPILCGVDECTYVYNGACGTHTPCDCLHHPGAGHGIAYGNGWFVSNWGHGIPGAVKRSRDGVTWEETLSEDAGAFVSFGDMSFGNGRFVLAGRTPYTSTDGAGWVKSQTADFRDPDGGIIWVVRDFNFIDGNPGRFIATAGPPDDVLLSDDGDTWRPPASRPPECVGDVGGGGVASGNGITVAVGSDGRLCTSNDLGDHWQTWDAGIGAKSVSSRSLIWTGSEFWVWGPGLDMHTHLYRSSDGTRWTSVTTNPTNVPIGVVARNSQTGTLVSSGGYWASYDMQQFYRSENGVDWVALPLTSFTQGHGITDIAFGYGAPSTVCPGL